MIRFRQLPMHVTFARGYQLGLFVAVVVSALVYLSVQTGLDRVADREGHARDATVLLIEVHETAELLGQVDTSPASLSLRSDLCRQSEPVLTERGPDHRVACHLVDDSRQAPI